MAGFEGPGTPGGTHAGSHHNSAYQFWIHIGSPSEAYPLNLYGAASLKIVVVVISMAGHGSLQLQAFVT